MFAYKLQMTGLADCWKTFLFDEDKQLFAPVSPFMDEHIAAAEAEFHGVQIAWYLDQLFAPAEFLAEQVPAKAAKIRLLIALIQKEFAADCLRQPYAEQSDEVVTMILTGSENVPSVGMFH